MLKKRDLGRPKKVAVKHTRFDGASTTALLHEIAIMTAVGRHLNIVSLLGVVTKGKLPLDSNVKVQC